MVYVVLAGTVAALGVISYWCLFKINHQRISSVGLTLVLAASFATWVGLARTARGQPLLAIVLFVGAIALFRLMGRFERAK